MRPFTEKEADRFYGRDAEIAAVKKQLRLNHFVAVIGPSGSGKSSLVFAGLLPDLYGGREFGGGEWLVRAIQPGEAPLAALSQALGGDTADPETAVTALLDSQPGATRLLLIVDQYEQLFTIGAGEQSSFEQALTALAALPACYPVLTVRADFYSALMQSSIWPFLQNYLYPLAPLDEDGLAEAIRGPAEDAGVYIEADLVERLIGDADVSGGASVLPFLQETLIELWGKMQRRHLGTSAYETLIISLSKAAGAAPTGFAATVADKAESAFNQLLSDEDKEVARLLFVRLVVCLEPKRAVRRRQPVARLRASFRDQARFDRVKDFLSADQQRLLTLGGEQESPEGSIDIVHDVLLSSWPRLQGWIEADCEAEQARGRFVERVAQWTAAGDAAYLIGGSERQQIETWFDEHPQQVPTEQEAAFLAASARHEQRARIMQYAFYAFVALFAGIGLLASGYLGWTRYLNWQARGPMVDFPASTAVLGSDESSQERSRPARPVDVPAFALDRYEVTNGQYALCVRAGACSAPLEPADAESYLDLDANLPVVFVNAYQAAAFCDWQGRTLPSEAQWERAARGTNGRFYPWEGDEVAAPGRANLLYAPPPDETDPDAEPPPDEAFPPGAEPPPGEELPPPAALSGAVVAVDDAGYAAYATPEGVTHLLGNVEEWTSTSTACAEQPYDCDTPWDGREKVPEVYLRGHSFITPVDVPETGTPQFLIEALTAEPLNAYPDVGFRCSDS